MCMCEKVLALSCSGNPVLSDCMGSGCRPLLGGQTGCSSSLPVPCFFHADKRSSGIIIAYFQRGIQQISSYWEPPSHASEPGYCSSGVLPFWRWHWSPWSSVLCLWLSHFQQWHGLELHRQIYNVDKSLYTNNLQSFNTLFCQKVNAQGNKRGQSSVGVHIFPSAIKWIWLDRTSGAVILTFHSGFG